MTRLSICLTASILTCSCLLPLSVVAQKIDFSNKRFEEPVDVEFWKRNLQPGLEIDSSDVRYPKVIFHRPVSFLRATFENTADFHWVTFDSTADFRGATFGSGACFRSAAFDSMSDFRGAIFNDTADFSYAAFNSIAEFSSAKFHSKADFRSAIFDAEADFTETTFDSSASFFDATFDSTAYFKRATFESTAKFLSADFGFVADFRKATFDSTADFRRATFEDTADFRWATFKKDAIFDSAYFDSSSPFVGREAQFHDMASFRWARLLGKMDIWRAKLPDSIDFRNVTEISHEIDFTYCFPPRKDGKCRIALEGADISKLKLNMKHFALSFPENTYIRPTGEVDTTFRDSSGVVDTIVAAKEDTVVYPTDDQRCSIYEQVLKKLKDDGLMESYEILDIEYRKFKARHKGGLSWYVADTFQDWWWNYGYTKERVFLWMLGLWFVFSVANLALYHRLSEGVYAIPFLDRWDYNRVAWPKRWIWYWLQVVTYTAIIFFGLKMDMAKFRQAAVRSHPCLFAYLMFIYVLGLVCLGFIVNIIFTR